MSCGCMPRIFRRGTRTCPSLDSLDVSVEKPNIEQEPSLPIPVETTSLEQTSPSSEWKQAVYEERKNDKEKINESFEEKTDSANVVEEKRLPSLSEKKVPLSDKSRWNGASILRFFWPPGIEETVSRPVRMEILINEEECVRVSFTYDEEGTRSIPKSVSNASTTIPSLFRKRGRKREAFETEQRTKPSPPSSIKTETTDDEICAEPSKTNPRSVFCFGWGSSGTLDEDEAIKPPEEIKTEAPPGLVGLINLGNTCFLNAALQCLRCTPGFATLVVPQLRNGFEDGIEKIKIKLLNENGSALLTPCPFHLKGQRSHSYSSKSLNRERIHSGLESVQLQCRSLSLQFLEREHRFGDLGLAGGCVQRMSSVPNIFFEQTQIPEPSKSERIPSCTSKKTMDETQHVEVSPLAETKSRDAPKAQINDRGEPELEKNTNIHHPTFFESFVDSEKPKETQAQEISPDPKPSISVVTQPTSIAKKITDVPENTNNEKNDKDGEEEEPMEWSTDFISAFQKLVLEVCLGDANKHRSPRDLYLQLKKLPQGEWFCDGGQHDCQEIIKVLLDAIHANYVDVTVDRSLASYGRCMSDVSSGVMDTLHAIELENLKANSMWKRYLSNDTSPITDVFAGQLQIVRSCQKCHSRSSTYEPFWDLSLSLSKEKTSWFNPGRMPSSLDDLLKAFTAAEVLQGEDAPFCEDCDQKSPATRRILIHRFPKVLVINIKRFKYTKDGREKLTSNVSFPVRGLRLQNFASKEYQHSGITELYDLYAVSNHYGTLGGGHYIAFCKVKDANGKEGWYCFNDKNVTKITEDAIVTPNAYILFYAKRPTLESQPNDSFI